ncbi:ABC transporter ATP-binding protein [Luteococcus sp.]|uniref:ABC transporter ATP-binding protein n=1 Tax=Luteococcus sp. TaxID=1969402 RepID=UPI003734D4ED
MTIDEQSFVNATRLHDVTPEAPIVVRGLSKSLGGDPVLHDITFVARRGAVTGLVGPNGSGKTTTLRCLLALAEPDSGQALVEGVPYRQIGRPARILGAMCENAGLQPGRSANDHLELAQAMASVSSGPASTQQLLDQVGLPGCGKTKVGQMSLGMRQRLALAIALVGSPKILVLDEPANGLDPEGIEWLRGFLRRFAANGGTVLITSHILSEMQRLVDAVVVIRGGRVVAMSDTCPDDLEDFYHATQTNERVRT